MKKIIISAIIIAIIFPLQSHATTCGAPKEEINFGEKILLKLRILKVYIYNKAPEKKEHRSGIRIGTARIGECPKPKKPLLVIDYKVLTVYLILLGLSVVVIQQLVRKRIK